MGKSVDSALVTRFEAVPKQMAGLEIAPRVLCICPWYVQFYTSAREPGVGSLVWHSRLTFAERYTTPPVQRSTS